MLFRRFTASQRLASSFITNFRFSSTAPSIIHNFRNSSELLHENETTTTSSSASRPTFFKNIHLESLINQQLQTVESELAQLLLLQKNGNNSSAATLLRQEMISEWVQSEMFEDPDQQIFSARNDPDLMCRWLIVSSELLIGEDHVDWMCEELYHERDRVVQFFEDEIKALKNDRDRYSRVVFLCIRTISVFENWMIKETPQCFGMVPLLRVIASHIDLVSAEEVAGLVQRINAIFRKRDKADRHIPVPDLLDRELSLVIRALAHRYLFTRRVVELGNDSTPETIQGGERIVTISSRGNNNEMQRSNIATKAALREWCAVANRLFKIGIRRVPISLNALIESMFQEDSGVTEDEELFEEYRTVFPHIIKERLEMQNDSAAGGSMTRLIVDALDVIAGSSSSSSARSNYTSSKILLQAPMFSVVLSQIAAWPFHFISLVTGLSLNCYTSLLKEFLEEKNKSEDSLASQKKQEEFESLINRARMLLVVSLRCSYFGFTGLVKAERQHVSQQHQHLTQSRKMNVEAALNANKYLSLFLPFTSSSSLEQNDKEKEEQQQYVLPNEIILAAACGVPENPPVGGGKTYSFVDESSSSVESAVERLKAPALIVSSRFPHLAIK